MQHTKDKKSISEITKYCGDSKKLTGTFEGLLKNLAQLESCDGL